MSTKMINIGGDPNDIYYRYKMSPLQIKIEGRGNGIKTILTNICTIAKDLRTEASYLTKFFGIECATQSKYDNKRNVGTINGKHQQKQLQLILNKFINQFILCPKCEGPGLRCKVNQKKRTLLQKCYSCGWQGKNTSNHKVKSYIIKHPPKKRKKKHLMNTQNNNNANILEWYGDDKWSVDTADNAVLERKQQQMENLSSKNKANLLMDNDEKKEVHFNDDSPKQILKNYINPGKRSDLEILDEIKRISLARKLDQKRTLQLSIGVLCQLDTLEGFIESLKQYKVILKTFASNAMDIQIFFGVLEEVICRETCDEILENVCKVLECLYGEEIVSNDDILLWADLPTDKAIIIEENEAESIKKNASSFIKWLRENDSNNDNGKQ